MANGGSYYSGLGAAGTRITSRLDLKTDLLSYILKALVIIVALDVALFCVMAIGWLADTWLFVPLTTTLIAAFVSWFILAFIQPPHQAVEVIVGNLWCIGLAAGVLLAAPFMPWSLWRWLNAGFSGQISDAIAEAWGFGWIGLVVSLFVWFVGALKKTGKVTLTFLVGLVIIWTSARFEDWYLFALAWDRLRYLLIPYLWPVIGSMLLLALVMVYQQLFPNLEWLAKPLSLEELREIGLFGLLAPRLASLPPEEPPPERYVEVEWKEDKKRKYTTLPDSPEAREFYRAVKGGESFSLRTARKYGLSRKQFNVQIRDVFIGRGWADWHDERNPQQGIDMLPEGMKILEHLVLADTTPSPTG